MQSLFGVIVSLPLLTGGIMGRPPAPQHLGKVRLLFSNPDLLWSNEHPTGRFGQGAFRTALEALHKQVVVREHEAQSPTHNCIDYDQHWS